MRIWKIWDSVYVWIEVYANTHSNRLYVLKCGCIKSNDVVTLLNTWTCFTHFNHRYLWFKSSHHSSMVSMVACYRRGPGFKLRKGDNFKYFWLKWKFEYHHSVGLWASWTSIRKAAHRSIENCKLENVWWLKYRP